MRRLIERSDGLLEWIVFTPWFPADAKPVRNGVYEVSSHHGPPWYRCFNGGKWGMGACDPDLAVRYIKSGFMADKNLPWRGIANKGGPFCV